MATEDDDMVLSRQKFGSTDISYLRGAYLRGAGVTVRFNRNSGTSVESNRNTGTRLTWHPVDFVMQST